MNYLLIDIETYSSVDITKSGVYKYVESDDFDVVLFSYSIDGAPAVIVDTASGEEMPADIRHACYDPTILKVAHNMQFEITCLSKYFGQPLDPEQWQDTMILCAYLALPLSLDQAGKVLRLEEQKSATGKRLIGIFSKPNSRTGKRVFPEEKPTQWDDFKAYCLQDVDTEVALYNKVRNRVPIPSWERELQMADFRINHRGVRIDTTLALNACRFWDRYSAELVDEMKSITGLDNPNSVSQLKDWLAKKGYKFTGLDKVTVAEALKGFVTPTVRRVLELRQELGKTSVTKYQAMLSCACSDGRAHGITQYYGASATGRWSGRFIQAQNLPQNHISDLAFARQLLADNDYDGMVMSYASISDTLSQLIRTALIPSEGRVFHVCDFSAIECRVLAWLAGENWVLDVFRNNGDIYCATASNMFGVPVEKHGQNAELRQKGKIATLALGYQGGVGALRTMGGERMGLKEDEMKDIVRKWRNANPHIVHFWGEIEKAVRKTIITGQPSTIHRGITFSYRYGWLFATLPSGRTISYPRALVQDLNGEEDRVTYERTDQKTRKWGRAITYGGKLTENCIAEGALVLTNKGLVPIEKITTEHLIWDGVEWVEHEGLVYKGEQDTISVNGVRMTPDHKILTTKGWKQANESKGYNWAEVSTPNCYPTSREHLRWQKSMAVQMRLWERDSSVAIEPDTQGKRKAIMRLFEGKIASGEAEIPRNVPSSCLRCMALYEAAMLRPEPSCMEKLRRTWHWSMRSLVRLLRGLLGRYGTFLSARIGIRPNRQQQGLLQGELQMGQSQDQQQEQKEQCNSGQPDWPYDDSRIIGEIWDKCNNPLLPSSSQMAQRVSIDKTKCTQRVYDIRNCGKRHRFVVYSDGGYRIVHNCVQAIARDILSMVILRCEKAGLPIVFHVHDEIIVDSPKERTLEEIENIFGEPISWADGLPLKGAGYTTPFYMKD